MVGPCLIDASFTNCPFVFQEATDDNQKQVSSEMPTRSVTYQCPFCTATYRSVSGFRNHTRQKHHASSLKGSIIFFSTGKLETQWPSGNILNNLILKLYPMHFCMAMFQCNSRKRVCAKCEL